MLLYRTLLVLVVFANVSLPSYANQLEIVLDGLALSDWGEWGALVQCEAGTYVYGMRLKNQFDQGDLSDDSALNAIDLLCINPMKQRPATNASIAEFSVITSTEGHKGVHGPILECPAPGFALGFQLRTEPSQSIFADDTAGNNLNLYCSDGTTLEGYGQPWGEWTPPVLCPRGLRLCAIQTRVEGPTSDDTSLNNVNMGCCS